MDHVERPSEQPAHAALIATLERERDDLKTVIEAAVLLARRHGASSKRIVASINAALTEQRHAAALPAADDLAVARGQRDGCAILAAHMTALALEVEVDLADLHAAAIDMIRASQACADDSLMAALMSRPPGGARA